MSLADDDFLPLIEHLVGPHPVEQAVLRQGEQHIHDCEWEQLAGVDEYPLQAGHLLLPESSADCRTASAEALAFFGDIEHVLYTDAPVAARGQAAEGQHLVFAQSIDELAGHTEDLRRLGGRDLVFCTQHYDTRTMRDVVEDLAHGGLGRGVPVDPLGKGLRRRQHRRVDGVERGCEGVCCHVLDCTGSCNSCNRFVAGLRVGIRRRSAPKLSGFARQYEQCGVRADRTSSSSSPGPTPGFRSGP